MKIHDNVWNTSGLDLQNTLKAEVLEGWEKSSLQIIICSCSFENLGHLVSILVSAIDKLL